MSAGDEVHRKVMRQIDALIGAFDAAGVLWRWTRQDGPQARGRRGCIALGLDGRPAWSYPALGETADPLVLAAARSDARLRDVLPCGDSGSFSFAPRWTRYVAEHYCEARFRKHPKRPTSGRAAKSKRTRGRADGRDVPGRPRSRRERARPHKANPPHGGERQ